jgi:hypothetical protein
MKPPTDNAGNSLFNATGAGGVPGLVFPDSVLATVAALGSCTASGFVLRPAAAFGAGSAGALDSSSGSLRAGLRSIRVGVATGNDARASTGVALASLG